ncbi:MAG: hypothetical protein H7Y15_18395 [Pseudonocardia sp.]|nr:hypothetical protein [Pseudonocardia sp.]
MPHSWEDYRRVAIGLDADAVDQVIGWQGRRYVELDESGWGALIAWLAGPDHVLRVPGGQVHEREVIVTTTSGGGSRTEVEPFGQEDATTVAGFIDDYLEAADAVEPRPFGDRWFLEIPGNRTPQDLRSHLNRAVEHRDPHPAANVVPLREALARLFPA